MPTIETALTQLLQIKHPIMLAPMGVAAGGKFAAAVTHAGGLATAADDFGKRVDWAGESVDLVRDNSFAPDVIERIVDQAAAVLQGGAALVR